MVDLGIRLSRRECCRAGGVMGGRGEWGTILESSNWTLRLT